MDINIVKSARACCGCDADFVHEQAFSSTLEVRDGELSRSDFCAKCFDADDHAQSYSIWSSEFYDASVAEQEPPEQFSPLRTIFYEAVEAQDRPGMAVAYLAAQLLRRQKVFRLIKESQDPDTDAALILFSDRIGKRLIEVNDPSLSHAELEEARVRLLEKLSAMENLQSEEGVEDGQSEEQYAKV